MGVYIIWFLLCISGIALAIVSVISANQHLPKVQAMCVALGGLLLLVTLGLSVYDSQVKQHVDAYFTAMQLLPVTLFAWIAYFSGKQLRRNRP